MTPEDIAAIEAALKSHKPVACIYVVAEGFREGSTALTRSLSTAHNAMPAFRKLLALAAQGVRCEHPIDGPKYTDAAGSTDFDQSPCGACAACLATALDRRLP